MKILNNQAINKYQIVCPKALRYGLELFGNAPEVSDDTAIWYNGWEPQILRLLYTYIVLKVAMVVTRKCRLTDATVSFRDLDLR